MVDVTGERIADITARLDVDLVPRKIRNVHRRNELELSWADLVGRVHLRQIDVGVLVEMILQGLPGDLLVRQPGLGREVDSWIVIDDRADLFSALSDPGLAMPAVIATNVWRGVPFFAVMLLAGLQAIPDELYEAARVDGARVIQRFRHITLPLLRPIIIVATATRIIWTFNYADLIFVMTSGGPANATQITSTYTLVTAYTNLDFGYAATLSVVLLVIMLVFTILYLRVTRGIESVT